MEKRWCVEVWGEIGDFHTELFFTKREAERYFKQIRRVLDSAKFIIKRDEIIDKQNDGNRVVLTDLDNDL